MDEDRAEMVQSHESQVEESRRLSRLAVRLGERAKLGFVVAVAPFGLPVPVARALLLLVAPTPMRALADRIGCDPSYLTAIADQLEARGLARRTAGCDRRVKMLEVTPEGAGLRDRLADAVTSRSPFTRILSGEERRTLADLLERLLEEDRPDESGAPQRTRGAQQFSADSRLDVP